MDLPVKLDRGRDILPSPIREKSDCNGLIAKSWYWGISELLFYPFLHLFLWNSRGKQSRSRAREMVTRVIRGVAVIEARRGVGRLPSGATICDPKTT